MYILLMKDKSEDRFQITEMFCAQIDNNRMYTGCIKRLRDTEGNQFVFSRIVMPHGLLCARETEQIALGRNLDLMAKDIVDGNLHGDAGVSTEIFGSKYFLN
jgi:hypothetical protein